MSLPNPLELKLHVDEGSHSIRPPRFLFLDGLRGIASFYVVMHHAFLEVDFSRSQNLLPNVPKVVVLLLELGRVGVDVFIVLSGYCLMLPIVRAGKQRIVNLPRFFKRRAWRILPPYYIAFALSLLCVALIPGMGVRTGSHWDIVLPAFSVGNVVTHLLLIHNFFPQYVYRGNHALWSVATEWQIYFIFPALLLPTLRRFGPLAMVLAGFLPGIALYLAVPVLNSARLWYVGLFALGALAANLRRKPELELCGRRPWGIFAISTAIVLLMLPFSPADISQQVWVPDCIVGLFTTFLLLHCAQAKHFWPSRWIVGALESKPVVWLGLISYSLYLIHPLIIAMCNIAIRHLAPTMSAGGRLIYLLVGGTLLSVLAGGVFFFTVERWFVPSSDPRRNAMLAPLPQSTFGTAT